MRGGVLASNWVQDRKSEEYFQFLVREVVRGFAERYGYLPDRIDVRVEDCPSGVDCIQVGRKKISIRHVAKGLSRRNASASPVVLYREPVVLEIERTPV